MTRNEVMDLLTQSADPVYKEFNDRITNCRTASSIGLRIPRMREIAALVVKNGWEEYIAELEAADTASLYQEEHLLWGIILGKVKLERGERVRYLDRWVPGVMSWADCDSSVSGFKFMKKEQDFWFDYCCSYLAGEKEFEVRFALVALMQYFINDVYIDRLLEIFGAQASSSADTLYYIQMARAWALSVCFVKYRDRTLRLFEERRMDAWVQNKAIQKCRESYRVSPEDKELLKRYKMR